MGRCVQFVFFVSTSAVLFCLSAHQLSSFCLSAHDHWVNSSSSCLSAHRPSRSVAQEVR